MAEAQTSQPEHMAEAENAMSQKIGPREAALREARERESRKTSDRVDILKKMVAATSETTGKKPMRRAKKKARR